LKKKDDKIRELTGQLFSGATVISESGSVKMQDGEVKDRRWWKNVIKSVQEMVPKDRGSLIRELKRQEKGLAEKEVLGIGQQLQDGEKN